MSREIIFKGKRKDDGEWAEGCLLSDEKTPEIMYIGYVSGVEDGVVHDVDIAEVYPDTVCQYTGLNDENGKRIWENDIVKVKYSDNFEEITQVVYTEHGYSPYSNEFECERCSCMCEILEAEVIGNIFDNPELLQEVE